MKKFRLILVLIAIVLLGIFVVSKNNLIKLRINTKPNPIPDLVLVGSYQANSKTLLLQINQSQLLVNDISNILANQGIIGVHEMRTLKIGNTYKAIFGTYYGGKLLIFSGPTNDLGKMTKEYGDTFGDKERVRAVYTGDLNGDGQDEIVIGTRPSGMLKIYQFINGKWASKTIDKLDETIHDVVVADTDGDGKNEIFVTTSTTPDAPDLGLPTKSAGLIEYYPGENGSWNKRVLWQPSKSAKIHPRYLFTGNFNGGSTPQVFSVIRDDIESGRYLLLESWNGSNYSQFIQPLATIKLNPDVVTSGDIDGDGISEIVAPTMAGDALLLYKWTGSKFEQSVITKNAVDPGPNKDNIIAITMLDRSVNGHKVLLYVVAGRADRPDSTLKFYTLIYDQSSKTWNRNKVDQKDYPVTDAWGLFPLSF